MLTVAETEQTCRAFDAAAPVYDAAYEDLTGIRRIRSVTRQLYLRYFPSGGNLLEVNCGTGNDAIFLAHHGMKILATDLSPRMLEEVRKKIVEEGLEDSVDTRNLPFEKLPELRGMAFDGAYSNLGGMNCTNSLESLAAAIGALLRPGGHFIATIMPSFCLWETVAFLGRLRWKDAFRRQSRTGTLANLHGGTVRTYYHSPGKVCATFAPYFEHVKTLGLVIFMPPPNFVRAYEILGACVPVLQNVDNVVAGFPPFRSIGDHYALVLRRKAM